jgi:hypothetical protein
MSSLLEAVETTLGNGTAAKELLVREEGVGSDLIPSVFGFDAWGQPVGYAALIERPDGNTSIEPLVQAALVMRRAWGCHIVALLVEGYTAPRSDDPRSLLERFPTDPDVRECLTVHAASATGHTCNAVQPYTVTVGRKVVWFDQQLEETETPADPLGRVLVDALASTQHEPWVWTFEDGFGALSELGFVAVGDDASWDDN